MEVKSKFGNSHSLSISLTGKIRVLQLPDYFLNSHKPLVRKAF